MENIKGLSIKEVEKRKKEGLINIGTTVKTNSFKVIVLKNICTLFNLVNTLLAVGLLLLGSVKNIMFMGVVFWNIIIGIVQEVRAKIIIDRLSILNAPNARVIRDGERSEIPLDEIVLGDVCVLESGNQICADGIILEGECEVNESLLTGESDPVYKKKGDEILSGSFLVSGNVVTEVIHVGEDNYVNSITNGAKYTKKINSEIYNSCKMIVKIVSCCIAPVFALLMCKQLFISKIGFRDAFIATTASVIGMIPSGLILLISMVLALSVIRLSKYKTLVQDMYCIETLARVDVLCLDKTGTITEGRMKVEDIISVSDKYSEEQVKNALTEFACANKDNNPTSNAIKEAYGKGSGTWKIHEIIGFSSEKKWSLTAFEEKGSYIAGAYEFIFDKKDNDVIERIEEYQKKGRRVLAFARTDGLPTAKELPPAPELLALIVISDVIREEARATLEYFRKQNVDVKIISGDNMVTVSNVAKEAGVDNADICVDATTLDTDEKVEEAAEKYTVFGRVTPSQKLKLVKALRKKGHTVGMTGDGVNDVLALKEADCSIAMQSGSDAARNVSNFVLMDSNFASMPKILAEGRRNINNLQRSASLFLTKTTYSILLAVIFLIIPLRYPFEPIHLTLVSSLAIGIPSFVLALEANYNIVRGRFLKNVLRIAVPAGVIIVLNIIAAEVFGMIIKASQKEITTMALFVMACASIAELFRLCRPFTSLRGFLIACICAIFCGVVFMFGETLFTLTDLSGGKWSFVFIALAVTFVIRNIYIKRKA
ncbi:MAG: HAD family hydrolase [Lachnospiraceae bacterium]|nr:HAD family hydrolase [Lachnospiraceae bacterium]